MIKTIVINSSNITESLIYLNDIKDMTSGLRRFYPKYSSWLKKVFSELSTDRRKIILLKEYDRVIGMAILKIDERIKLHSFIIRKEYRRKGYGDYLMNVITTRFSKNPIFTINEKVFYQFRSLLIKYNFKYSKIEKGVYRKKDTEIYFNL